MSIFINNSFLPAHGPLLTRHDPASGELTYSEPAASADEVDQAIRAARAAFPGWAAKTFEQRLEYLVAFAAELRRRADDLTLAISREIGKPRWESRSEVDSMIAKVDLTRAAFLDRRHDQIVAPDSHGIS